MTQQPPKQKKKLLGNAIIWTDDDLSSLTQISQADIKAAEALWESEAPKPLKTLLQAEVIEEDRGQSS